MAKKHLLLNAFNMNSVGHINHGLWTHPRDTSTQYNTLSHWVEQAKLLERGLFDGLFMADILGVYDSYQQSANLTLRESVQWPINDPALLVSAMAGVTQHLGFGITANLSYEAPHGLARRYATLDHLSQGRVGWNIVTGYLDSAARAMGSPQQLPHDERYDRADEYLALLYALWEGGGEEGAVRPDPAAPVYADPARVPPVQHPGRRFKSDGAPLCAPTLQRTPVLFQAGSSARGLRFAARHAECVFVSIQDRDSTRRLVQQLREALPRAGRAPEDVKVFMGLTVVVAPTERQAREKFDEYRRYASPEAGILHLAATSGIDFSAYADDAPLIQQEPSNGIQNAISRLSGGRLDYTLGHLRDDLALGGRYMTVVGDPQQVADQLQQWVADTGIDGFNLARTVYPESWVDFIDLVVPELQNRGLYKTQYTEGSLRHKLFGQGPHLDARHPGRLGRRGCLPA